MINTVRQLMHNIRLFCGTRAPPLHHGGKPELKFFVPPMKQIPLICAPDTAYSRHTSVAKIPRVPVENQITILSAVKIAIKFSPCTFKSSNWKKLTNNKKLISIGQNYVWNRQNYKAIYIYIDLYFGIFFLGIGTLTSERSRRKVNLNGYSQNRNSFAQLAQREEALTV